MGDRNRFVAAGLAALVLLLPGCSPAEPDRRGEGVAAPKEKTFAEEEAAKAADRRRTVQKMVDLHLLRPGHFRMIGDRQERAEEMLKMEKAFRANGIAAAIQDCSWMGVLANGNASGSYTFGAVCKVMMGERPPATFILCSENFGAVALAKPDAFGRSDEDLELILRRLCL